MGSRPEKWTRFRRAGDDEPRPVEQVSLRELGNAMVSLCAASAGMPREELLRETLAIFGGRRLTPGITQRLDEARTVAVAGGRQVGHRDGVYTVA